MFAVKGWAVDAKNLKPQTEPFKSTSTADQNGDAKQGSSKKRKRGSGSAPAEDDVGKLWERHIEGRKPVSSKKQAQKERKRQRTGANEEPVGPRRVRDDDNTKAPADDPQKTSKRQKKAQAREQRRASTAQTNEQSTEPATTLKVNSTNGSKPAPPPPELPIASKLTPMQAAMRQKLVSARFRHLNETLYTAPSNKALEMFGQNPEMFEDYHAGFRQQVSVWPENPVDNFIAAVRERGKVKLPSQKRAFKNKNRQEKTDDGGLDASGNVLPLPRTHGACVIADLGCGDARLAHTFKESGDARKLNLKVLSYDLHSPSPLVTKADVSNLPAADGSVDVAIFCLALMGTNWISFIEEAYRILHWKGELWVAEIKSRFGRVSRAGKPVEHSVGGKRKQAAITKAKEAKRREEDEVDEQQALEVHVDGVESKNEETDVTSFIDVLRRRGFVLKDGDSSIDLGNKMFVKMEFVKAATPTKGKGVPEATPAAPQKPKSKAKFLDNAVDDPATEDEAKVLKPSLYKIR